MPLSALHFLAAVSSACSSASSWSSSSFFAFALPDTHLPKAFALFGVRAVLSLNATNLRAVVALGLAPLGRVLVGGLAWRCGWLLPGFSGLPLSAGGAARAAGTARAEERGDNDQCSWPCQLRRQGNLRVARKTRHEAILAPRVLRICEVGCGALARLTTVQPMAVTETGHLASREVDDLYRAARRRGLPLRVRGPREPRRRRGRHADDVPERLPRAGAGGAPRKPSNWLLTIASNAIKQRFRQEQSRPRQVELDERIAHVGAETTRARASASSSPRCRRFRRSSGRRSSCASSRVARTRDRRDPRRDDVRARDAALPRPPLARGGARAPAHVHGGAARSVEVRRRPTRSQGAPPPARPPGRVPGLRAVRAPPAASSDAHCAA